VSNQDYNPVTGDAEPTIASSQSLSPNLAGKTKVGGLDYKTAGLLCYLPIFPINLIASLVVVSGEPKDNEYLRFQAMQSLVLTVVAMVTGIALGIMSTIIAFIPIINMLGFVFSLASLGLWVVWIWQSVLAMVAVSKGETHLIPYISQIAKERLAQ
jgi:uncharacterized membrane protein